MAGSVALAPYTAHVTHDGCLEVLDGACDAVWTNHGLLKAAASPPPRMRLRRLDNASAASIAARPATTPRPPSPRSTAILVTPSPKIPRPPPARTMRRPAPKVSPPQKPRPPMNTFGTAKPPAPSTRLVALPTAAKAAPPATTPLAATPPNANKAVQQQRSPPPARAKAAKVPPSRHAKGFTAPKAMRPPPRPRSEVPDARPVCALQQGDPCGGISFCGADQPCQHIGCCKGPMVCERYSEYVRRCVAP